MILDYVFMGPLQMGIQGAALATGLGQVIPALAGLIYFFCREKYTAHCKAALQPLNTAEELRQRFL